MPIEDTVIHLPEVGATLLDLLGLPLQILTRLTFPRLWNSTRSGLDITILNKQMKRIKLTKQLSLKQVTGQNLEMVLKRDGKNIKKSFLLNRSVELSRF